VLLKVAIFPGAWMLPSRGTGDGAVEAGYDCATFALCVTLVGGWRGDEDRCPPKGRAYISADDVHRSRGVRRSKFVSYSASDSCSSFHSVLSLSPKPHADFLLDSVTSIIFCTALSEYDQVLEEEQRVVSVSSFVFVVCFCR
jgi:hypothetical protein